jgi:hypothetical protein
MTNKEKEPQEKKEVFETPKVLNLEGKEITDEELEEASGGLAAGNDCHTGTGSGNTCNTGTNPADELQ